MNARAASTTGCELGSLTLEHLFHPRDDTAGIDHLGADPIAAIARLGERTPFISGTGTDFGAFKLPNMMLPRSFDDRPSFMAATWDAGRAVDAHPAVFSASALRNANDIYVGRSIQTMDAPQHNAYRMPFQAPFTPRAVMSSLETIIKPVLHDRFAAIAAIGRADLARDLNVYWPFQIVSAFLGVDYADMPYIANLVRQRQGGNYEPERAHRAGTELYEYTRALIERTKPDPADNLITHVLRTGIVGEDSPEHFLAIGLMHLMLGGIDTVFKTANNTICLLLDNPAQFALLKHDRELIPATITESMRVATAVSWMPRIALKDITVLGVEIPADTIVWVANTVINRDARRWPDPTRFDITREVKPNRGFGGGAHICLGMHLAKLELALYLELVLDRLPNLRWNPQLAQVPPVTGWTARGINSLPVIWDV